MNLNILNILTDTVEDGGKHPSPLKNWFVGHVKGYFCKWKVWGYQFYLLV